MTVIIGICGGSGAGKTTLLKRLKNELKGFDPTVLSMDNYYKPIDKQVVDLNGEVNFDLPSALDEQKLNADLAKLIAGDEVRLLEYNFNSGNDAPKELILNPSNCIIVEGLFTLHYAELKSKLSYSIYVEIDKEEQLKRRIKRDVANRGYSEEMIRYQWHNHVVPCYQKYLSPYKQGANFVYHNDERADKDFSQLLFELKKELNF